MIDLALEAQLVLAAMLAACLSMGLIVLLRPWLLRHALAQPNARSSHRAPTPQGGGIAVIAATLTVAWGAVALSSAVPQAAPVELVTLTLAAVLLAMVGALDDVRPLPELVRLGAQFVAVIAVVTALPHGFRVLPQLPWWLEHACLVLGGVWLINLTNFMDGIDWMTVAEVVPVSGALVLLGLSATIDFLPALGAASLLGATLGFAPFNKPVARLFLGDVGSLPIGLLLGWLLLQLAGHGHLAAALILPLYYLADATITLARRIARREPIWQAHRTHFYQRATDNGFKVPEIVARVFLLNLALAALALVSAASRSAVVPLLALAVAGALVTGLLTLFARPRR